MNPVDPANLYADSPERMLGLSILCLVALVLLVVSNRFGKTPRRAQAARRAAELPAATPRPPLERPIERHAT